MESVRRLHVDAVIRVTNIHARPSFILENPQRQIDWLIQESALHEVYESMRTLGRKFIFDLSSTLIRHKNTLFKPEEF